MNLDWRAVLAWVYGGITFIGFTATAIGLALMWNVRTHERTATAAILANWAFAGVPMWAWIIWRYML